MVKVAAILSTTLAQKVTASSLLPLNSAYFENLRALKNCAKKLKNVKFYVLFNVAA